MNAKLFEEWLDMRTMIEDWAAPRAVATASVDDFSRLKHLLETGAHMLAHADAMNFDFYTFIETYDTGFHKALIALTGNNQIVEAFGAIHTHARVGRSMIKQIDQLSASMRSQDWHERILNALTRRNAKLLTQEMRAHREESASTTLAMLKQGALA